MRIPKVFESKNKFDEIQKETIKMELTPMNFFAPDWEDDEKNYIKLIKNIERLVRNSYEYKNYIKFLKDEIDMNCCSFFRNLTRDDINIEIHHSPLTLFEITTIVFSKHCKLYGNSNINIYDISEEITKLHYENLVGLIPLSLTVHELVHRGDIFIPLTSVYGNVSKFYKDYKEYFSEEQVKLLKNHIMTTKQIDKEKYRPSVLERKYTYIEIDGLSLPKLVQPSVEADKIS